MLIIDNIGAKTFYTSVIQPKLITFPCQVSTAHMSAERS